jgi:hypothetical protein
MVWMLLGGAVFLVVVLVGEYTRARARAAAKPPEGNSPVGDSGSETSSSQS